MIKTITKQWLRKQGACGEAVQAWNGEKDHGTIITLNRLIKHKQYDWANWLIVRVMERKRYLRYAIYAAKQVIAIYEKRYPGDDQPRLAIRAAEKCLMADTKKNRAAAYAAANAAYAAANAAAYAAAYAAANAAYAAANAAYAAAYAAANAAYAPKQKMQLKILRYGMRLLKEAP
jgi:hypothetical protein